MKWLIPLALSFAVSACPGREELPRNLLPAQARAAAPALDHTLARELHFAPDAASLSEPEKNALDDFLVNADARSRIRELKVILWLPQEAKAQDTELVRARVSRTAELLIAHKIPYEIVMLESPFYADSQGSVLAVLEP